MRPCKSAVPRIVMVVVSAAKTYEKSKPKTKVKVSKIDSTLNCLFILKILPLYFFIFVPKDNLRSHYYIIFIFDKAS